MKKILLIFMSCLFLIFSACGQTENFDGASQEEIRDCARVKTMFLIPYDYIDMKYTFKLASFYGGNKYEQAYNMIVAINKVSNGDFGSIQDLVLFELYKKNELDSRGFEEIKVSDQTLEAFNLILSGDYLLDKNALEFYDYRDKTVKYTYNQVGQ